MTTPTTTEITRTLLALNLDEEHEATIKGTRWVIVRSDEDSWQLTKMSGYLISSVVALQYVSVEQAVATMAVLS